MPRHMKSNCAPPPPPQLNPTTFWVFFLLGPSVFFSYDLKRQFVWATVCTSLKRLSKPVQNLSKWPSSLISLTSVSQTKEECKSFSSQILFGAPWGNVFTYISPSRVHTLCRNISSLILFASLTKYLLQFVRFSYMYRCRCCHFLFSLVWSSALLWLCRALILICG